MGRGGQQWRDWGNSVGGRCLGGVGDAVLARVKDWALNSCCAVLLAGQKLVWGWLCAEEYWCQCVRGAVAIHGSKREQDSGTSGFSLVSSGSPPNAAGMDATTVGQYPRVDSFVFDACGAEGAPTAAPPAALDLGWIPLKSTLHDGKFIH